MQALKVFREVFVHLDVALPFFLLLRYRDVMDVCYVACYVQHGTVIV